MIYFTIALSLSLNRLYLIKVPFVFISFAKEFPIFKGKGVAQMPQEDIVRHQISHDVLLIASKIYQPLYDLPKKPFFQ